MLVARYVLVTSSGRTVRTSESDSWSRVALGSDAEALHAVEPSDAISSRTSMMSVDPPGPIRAWAPASTAAWTFAVGSAPGSATELVIVSGPSSTPPPSFTSSAANPLPRSWPWNSVANRPGDGARSPSSKPSPVNPASVVGALASVASVVSGTVLADDESSSLLHPATITAAATNALTGRIHLLRPIDCSSNVVRKIHGLTGSRERTVTRYRHPGPAT